MDFSKRISFMYELIKFWYEVIFMSQTIE